MKKILSFIIAVAMIFTMSVVSFAATVDQDSAPQSGSSIVEYKIGVDGEGNVVDTYTVVIPEKITAAANDGTAIAETVTASNVLIGAGETLKVTLDSRDTYVKNDDDATVKFAYDLKLAGTRLADAAEVLLLTAGTTEGTSGNITAVLSENATVAGVYHDTAVFGITID